MIFEYSYFEIPVLFNGDQDPFSLSVMVRINKLQGRSTIYGEYHTDGSIRNYVAINEDGSVIFDQHYPMGGEAKSDSGLVIKGEWVHLVVVKINNTVIFYKDGSQFGSSVSHNESYSGATPIVAGIGA